jgi:hypothetical protein
MCRVWLVDPCIPYGTPRQEGPYPECASCRRRGSEEQGEDAQRRHQSGQKADSLHSLCRRDTRLTRNRASCDPQPTSVCFSRRTAIPWSAALSGSAMRPRAVRSGLKRPKHVELARGYSVARYLRLEEAHDSREIARLISRRFTERYLAPTLASCNVKHGFSSMAIGCLMVEALESFRQGWPDTKNKSQQAFCSFFEAHDEFAAFRGHAERFWKDVRCGILHQAETRGGWRIRRSGVLFDPQELTVNATAFMGRLGRVLKSYCRRLATADWEGDAWRKCRRKLKAMCDASVAS